MGNVLDCSSAGACVTLADAQKEETENYERKHGVPSNTRPSSFDDLDFSVLEKNMPFRDSQLWKIQRWYYQNYGMECWESMIVPSFVTSNAFIAQQTARVIAGYIRDTIGEGNYTSKEPVYVIEVGSGHGKFSFLVLQSLVEMSEFLPVLVEDEVPESTIENESMNSATAIRKPAFVYLITDVSQKALEAIASHPAMQTFLETGILELALFDAEESTQEGMYNPLLFTLHPSNDALEFSTAAENSEDEYPPLFICNYVFDSLVQDAFRIEDGVLFENRVTVQTVSLDDESPSEKYDNLGVRAMENVQIEWKYRDYPVPRNILGNYYGAERGEKGDEEFNSILMEYMKEAKEEFCNDGASILIPIGGLRLIQRLERSLPNGKFTILVGDKGYGSVGEMKGGRDPHIAAHGSFSCMVNMDALSRFSKKKGGHCMITPYQEGFKCQALCFGESGGFSNLPEFSMAWNEAFAGFGPESFSALQRAVKDEAPDPSLKLTTSLLRLSEGDPDVFFKFKANLVQHVSSGDLTPSAWNDLREDVSQVAGNNYHLQTAKDVSFEAGRLLMAMKDFKAALHLFSHSQATCGDHPATLLNMGMSTFCSGDYLAARDMFRRCVSINPSYEDGLQWLAHTERVISSGMSHSSSLSAVSASNEGNDAAAKETTEAY